MVLASRFDGHAFWVWSETGSAPRACRNRAAGDCTVPIDQIKPPEFRLEIDVDGTQYPPLHPDAPRVSTWMAQLDSELVRLFGWSSVRGDGGISVHNPNSHVAVIVGSSYEDGGDNALKSWSVPNNDPSQEFPFILLGSQMTVPDVLAHEFGHLITEAAYGPMSHVEQGALKEHYSDVIALAIFPPADGGWDLAAESPLGPARNMLEPTAPHTRSGSWTVDHVSNKGRCDSLFASCMYEWLGIPNRAFALIASGVPNPVPGTTPLGRETSARLYFETLRPPTDPSTLPDYQIHPIDRFVNQRLKILALCHEAVARPSFERAKRWSGSRPITKDDCTNTGRAFDTVGVVATISHGFDRFQAGTTTGTWYQSIRQGATLYQGCTLAGHVLNLEIRRGQDFAAHLSRSDTDTPPLFIDFRNGEVRVEVIERCGSTSVATCPNDTVRSVTYKVLSKWETSPRDPFLIWVDERLNVPSGLQADDCEVPVGGYRPAYYWSTPIVFTGSTLAGFAGKKEDRTIAPNMVNGSFVPGPCALLDIGGVDVHRDAMHPNPRVPQSAFSHGSHGFEVVRMGGSNDDYTAGLHTWVNAFSGIHARVVYKLAEPIGGTCAFNGIEGVP